MTVTEQMALPLTGAGAEPEIPRCRMCARPAWWMPSQHRYAPYCTSGPCSNRERICQACAAPFVMGIDGAGTKYCSTICRVAGPGGIAAAAPCAWCGKPPPDRKPRGGKWPYICEACMHPIRHVVPRLKEHNVPHERARRLLTEPGCEVCGIDLLERRRQANNKVAALLVVDHDHACCPVETHSCGKCVRGLICRHCNAAAGQLYDNPDTARALAAYLEMAHATQ